MCVYVCVHDMCAPSCYDIWTISRRWQLGWGNNNNNNKTICQLVNQQEEKVPSTHTYIAFCIVRCYILLYCAVLRMHTHTYQLQHLLMYIVNGKGKNILMDGMLIMFNVQDTHFLPILYKILRKMLNVQSTNFLHFCTTQEGIWFYVFKFRTKKILKIY